MPSQPLQVQGMQSSQGNTQEPKITLTADALEKRFRALPVSVRDKHGQMFVFGLQQMRRMPRTSSAGQQIGQRLNNLLVVEEQKLKKNR